MNCLLLILVLFVNSVISTQHDDYPWKPLVGISNSTFEKAFLPHYINLHSEIVENAAVGAPCREDILAALNSLHMRQTWAVKLFNAWGKFPPSGTVRGTLTDFGDYDQCLSIRNGILPQYCLLDIQVPMPRMPKHHNYHQKSNVLPPALPEEWSNILAQYLANGTLYRELENHASVLHYIYMQLGICLPTSCDNVDIAMIARKNVHKLGMSLNKFRCETKQNPNLWSSLNYVQITAILLIASMSCMLTIAAIYDRFFFERTHDKLRILLCFSPVRNIRRLLSTKSVDDELSCVHGLRFITILWIIIAHTLEWNNLNIYRDTFLVKDRLSQAFFQIIYKAFYSVETFFYLSGLLTSYVTLKLTNGEFRQFKLVPFVLFRFIRLTPQLFIFLLITSLLPVMFDGPIWQSYMSKLTDTCYKNWWINILYLQNVIDIGNICAVHTWYLAADMQLHWMSLIPVIMLLLNRQNGILLTKILIVICVCVSSVTIFVEKFPPGHIITSKNDFLDEKGMPSDFVAFLYKPWNHAPVFFIGFIFGVFVHQKKIVKNKYQLKKTTKYLLWCVVFVGYLFCIYNTLPYVQGRPYDHWSAILFPANRILWSAMLSLLIWLCVTNNGGLVGRILSWNGIKPFSRMTYPIYLTHAWVLWVALGTRKDLIDLNTRSLLVHCGGIIFLSLFVGFAFTVMLETPMINMMDAMKRLKKDDPPPKSLGQTPQASTSLFELSVLNKGNINSKNAAKLSRLLERGDNL